MNRLGETADGPESRPPILFLHGIFSRAAFLAPWLAYFESAGFECHAPSLPGRDPTDEQALRRIGLPGYFDAALAAREQLRAPPIVIGHSIGGLLAQQLAATTSCAALVLLASVPPGILWPQLRALPHLIRLLPGILGAKAILPSPETLRAIPLHTLPEGEQDEVIARMVPDSGRAFRSMTFGTAPTRVKRGAVRCPVLCVSGGADRNVSARASNAIAARYQAEHQIHPGKPHWIIAESALDDVAPPVLSWLKGATFDR